MLFVGVGYRLDAETCEKGAPEPRPPARRLLDGDLAVLLFLFRLAFELGGYTDRSRRLLGLFRGCNLGRSWLVRPGAAVLPVLVGVPAKHSRLDNGFFLALLSLWLRLCRVRFVWAPSRFGRRDWHDWIVVSRWSSRDEVSRSEQESLSFKP